MFQLHNVLEGDAEGDLEKGDVNRDKKKGIH